MTSKFAIDDLPDGISPTHIRADRASLRWLPLVVLSLVMILALAGVFGGGKVRPIVANTAAAQLEIATPRVIRNGEFFETRIRIVAHRPIGKAVLHVPATLWADMTINTMIPAPAEESASDGSFTFDYGELKAGETLDIKIDGQINPPLFAGTQGRVALYDHQRQLLDLPLSITVLP